MFVAPLSVKTATMSSLFEEIKTTPYNYEFCSNIPAAFISNLETDLLFWGWVGGGGGVGWWWWSGE